MSQFTRLVIPETLAAGPGPGNTDPRVLAAFAEAGLADHMQADVLRGLKEIKVMLRMIFGTQNVYTFAVPGTGWNGLDCMFNAIQPGDQVVAFTNGTFSGIDCQNIRMKASTPEILRANPLQPEPENVNWIHVPHGTSVTGQIVDSALGEYKPMWAFMAHWETGSGRINDLKGFSDACEKHSVLGLVDAVSSLGVADFDIDDYPGVVGWASCPQKGLLGLPLTYAPVSFSNDFVDIIAKRGCYSYVNHPILSARHWGIIDGEDVENPIYHQTHSCYAVSSFHEALRISLEYGRSRKANDYVFHESVLSEALTAMGCKVVSNMSSLVVLNLPNTLSGRENELVQDCRKRGFAIWPTLSEPVQVRIGILNQLSKTAIREIVIRFADAMARMGAKGIDKAGALNQVAARFAARGKLETDRSEPHEAAS